MQEPVKIYTLSTCSHCKATKKLLKDNHINYEFTDVDLLAGEEREAMLDKAFPKKSRIGPSPEEWRELCIQDWMLIEEIFGNLFRQRKEADWLALDDEDN